MSQLEQLEPKSVFHFFEELSRIPRGTFDMKRVSDYCVAFAKERNLEVIQDEVYNIIIKKNGTAGYESSAPVIIQGHLDMVCEKTEDSNHDFKKDPLELYVEDGFVKARNTTLGADNGIAVAMALALLDSTDIPHPPIEALFTVDEEIGMGGASAVDLSKLKGQMLMNLDSDNEGTIVAGCAGGFRQSIHVPVDRETKCGDLVEVQIRGLCGGHSGIEIDQQRGNANKIAARLLTSIGQSLPAALISVDGGTKDNVITSAATVRFMTEPGDSKKAVEMTEQMKNTLKAEFGDEEPNLDVAVSVREGAKEQCMTMADTKKIVFFLEHTPYGVYEFSRSLKGLVETSNNLGVVQTTDTHVTGMFLVRSSAASKLQQMREKLNSWAEYIGGEYEISGAYPAWMYKGDSRLRPIAIEVYKKMFGKEPEVTTIHAGLECGLLSGQKPDLDCISFGPFMYDIHSVKERLDIASTERTWEYMKEILKACK